MASSDVDQKFLGKFAQQTEVVEPFLSQQLYKILGLSLLLSKKLFRARRLRRLDVTRDTKSLQLYHHIIWLSREGLVILEVAVMRALFHENLQLRDLAEMQVLAQKLQGSFYHIFVLFHNQPSINRAGGIPGAQPSSSRRAVDRNSSIRKTVALSVPGHDDDDDDDDDVDPYEQTASRNPPTNHLPPGLAPIAIPKPTASFLLPATDYIPSASTAFDRSMKLARKLLGGSHPLRLSVAVEYCAYLYDCLHDAESSRNLAKVTIRNVYSATERMDDETFADSANLVSVLGKMMKRGLGGSTGTGSKTPSVANTGTTPSSPRRPPNPPASQSQPQSFGQAQAQYANSRANYPRPLQPHSSNQGHSRTQSQAQPQTTLRTHAPSSPRSGTTRDRSHSTTNSPSRTNALDNSYWDPASPGNSPLREPRMPATTNASPTSKSPKTKLPKMTPWEPPSPESARKKARAAAAQGELQDSPPRMRGGGTPGTAGFVRRNGEPATSKGKDHGRAMSPDEADARLRQKEEKRRRVEVAEKKSRSSEGLKGKVKTKTSSASREGSETLEGLVNGSERGKSRRR